MVGKEFTDREREGEKETREKRVLRTSDYKTPPPACSDGKKDDGAIATERTAVQLLASLITPLFE